MIKTNLGIEYTYTLAKAYTQLHANAFELPLLKTMLAGHVAIDVGCGSGRLLVPLQQLGFCVYGVEASEEMFDACLDAGGCDVHNVSAPSVAFYSLVEEIKPTLCYLSFSLHQIAPEIENQYHFLKELLRNSSVLLITTLADYFEVNPTTRYSQRMTEIDKKRFPTREWFYSNFDVAYSVDMLVDSPSIREQFVSGIESNHISTFQLLNDKNKALDIAAKAKASGYLPQVHSYIYLNKE